MAVACFVVKYYF